jgi:copper chaperone
LINFINLETEGGVLMNKTFEIKGMTCGHCEGRVTSEILTIPGVTEVIASAEKANVMVESDAEISQESIELAVQRAGYSVVK